MLWNEWDEWIKIMGFFSNYFIFNNKFIKFLDNT